MSYPIFELDGASTRGKSEKLMAQTDAHDGNLATLHEAAEMVNRILAMSGV